MTLGGFLPEKKFLLGRFVVFGNLHWVDQQVLEFSKNK